jgi:acyl carrier protein
MEHRIQSRIRDYVCENFLYTNPDAQLQLNEPLIGSGIVDSMGVMELIEFIQSEFGVTIDDGEITEENLGTLAAITGFIVSKTSLAAPVASAN